MGLQRGARAKPACLLFHVRTAMLRLGGRVAPICSRHDDGAQKSLAARPLENEVSREPAWQLRRDGSRFAAAVGTAACVADRRSRARGIGLLYPEQRSARLGGRQSKFEAG